MGIIINYCRRESMRVVEMTIRMLMILIAKKK